jgi:outer membrane protein assembly factor BamD (BamD/ComL family)
MKNNLADILKVSLILILTMLYSCKNEQSAWEKAQNTDSLIEIESFIKDFPQSKHLAEAQELLFYKKALITNTIDDYESFIKQYPVSAKLTEISKRLLVLKENFAYDVAVKANTVESYEVFIKQFPDSENAIKAKAIHRDLLLKDLTPDCVFVYGFTEDSNFGIWFGKLTYAFDLNSVGIQFQNPNPKKQKVVIAVLSTKNLPKELEFGKAYLWRGDKDFIYIRDIDKKQKPDVIAQLLGLKNLGANSFGEIPFK